MTLAYIVEKCSPLSAQICKKPCTISVFQKLWPFVSAHLPAFAILRIMANRPILIRFCHKYSLPASEVGVISNFSHFPVPEMAQSLIRQVNRWVLPSKIEHGLCGVAS